MKTKFFLSVLIILVFSSLFLNRSVNAQDAARLTVYVYKYMSEVPQLGAGVEIWQNGVPIESGTTNEAGYASFNLPNGTYDIYAYYPPRPNDGQSAQKLGFILTRNDMVKLHLGPNY